MADAASFIEEQKRQLLAAIAQGGQRAAQEYAQARAAVGAAQQGSINAALADSRVRGAGAPAEAAVQEIVARGAQGGLANLGAREAATSRLLAARGMIEDAYGNRMLETLPAIEAELRSYGGGRGGGGGGGGRGRGYDDDDEMFWRDLLTEAYGPTDTLRKAGLRYDADQMVFGTDTPRAAALEALADQFGMPQHALESMFRGPEFLRRGRAARDIIRAQGGTMRDYKRVLREEARRPRWRGSQQRMIRYLVQEAKGTLPKGKKKKGKR